MNRKPTRGDLLRVIGRLQSILGSVDGATNDRNPNRAAHIKGGLMRAHELCIEVLAQDPPEASTASGQGWGDDKDDLNWMKNT